MLFTFIHSGKSDTSDADHANSIVFTCINNQILLLALYRNDHLRVWSSINMQSLCAMNCVREGSEQRMQGRKILIIFITLYKLNLHPFNFSTK